MGKRELIDALADVTASLEAVLGEYGPQMLESVLRDHRLVLARAKTTLREEAGNDPEAFLDDEEEDDEDFDDEE